METLTASEAARKLHAKRSGRNELSHLATVARITQEVSAIKKRKAAERVAPTPERIAKGDIESRVDPIDGKRYGPRKTVLDHYAGKWEPTMEAAFMRLVSDSRAADVKGITVNYYANGGQQIGSRLGGLGAAAARTIESYANFQFVMDRLTGRSRKVCEWLLISRGPEDDPMDLEHVGRLIFPHIKDPARLRMIGLGRFIGAGDELVKLYTHLEFERRVQRRLRGERELA